MDFLQLKRACRGRGINIQQLCIPALEPVSLEKMVRTHLAATLFEHQLCDYGASNKNHSEGSFRREMTTTALRSNIRTADDNATEESPNSDDDDDDAFLLRLKKQITTYRRKFNLCKRINSKIFPGTLDREDQGEKNKWLSETDSTLHHATENSDATDAPCSTKGTISVSDHKRGPSSGELLAAFSEFQTMASAVLELWWTPGSRVYNEHIGTAKTTQSAAECRPGFVGAKVMKHPLTAEETGLNLLFRYYTRLPSTRQPTCDSAMRLDHLDLRQTEPGHPTNHSGEKSTFCNFKSTYFELANVPAEAESLMQILSSFDRELLAELLLMDFLGCEERSFFVFWGVLLFYFPAKISWLNFVTRDFACSCMRECQKYAGWLISGLPGIGVSKKRSTPPPPPPLPYLWPANLLRHYVELCVNTPFLFDTDTYNIDINFEILSDVAEVEKSLVELMGECVTGWAQEKVAWGGSAFVRFSKTFDHLFCLENLPPPPPPKLGEQDDDSTSPAAREKKLDYLIKLGASVKKTLEKELVLLVPGNVFSQILHKAAPSGVIGWPINNIILSLKGYIVNVVEQGAEEEFFRVGKPFSSSSSGFFLEQGGLNSFRMDFENAMTEINKHIKSNHPDLDTFRVEDYSTFKVVLFGLFKRFLKNGFYPHEVGKWLEFFVAARDNLEESSKFKFFTSSKQIGNYVLIPANSFYWMS